MTLSPLSLRRPLPALLLLMVILAACSPAANPDQPLNPTDSPVIADVPAAATEPTEAQAELTAADPTSDPTDTPPATSDELATDVPPTNAPPPATIETQPEAVQESSERFPAEKYDDLRIVTLLPPDAIPAVDDPEFLTADEADASYDPDELIIGVEFDGEARAYSVPYLSGHEIVNDGFNGVKFAVTW